MFRAWLGGGARARAGAAHAGTRGGAGALLTVPALCRIARPQARGHAGRGGRTAHRACLVPHCSVAGAGAILVNPWNINDLSQAIEYALMMSDAERRERHRQNYMHVTIHTAQVGVTKQ